VDNKLTLTDSNEFLSFLVGNIRNLSRVTISTQIAHLTQSVLSLYRA